MTRKSQLFVSLVLGVFLLGTIGFAAPFFRNASENAASVLPTVTNSFSFPSSGTSSGIVAETGSKLTDHSVVEDLPTLSRQKGPPVRCIRKKRKVVLAEGKPVDSRRRMVELSSHTESSRILNLTQ
mmetsp:Transcript_43179/g.70109  ORF Transcript_43179/g.70109 Transcript_43179/m.70109 type:complete len:126 (+) Transcript_43179:129-506(+)